MQVKCRTLFNKEKYEDERLEMPLWVGIESLNADAFQGHGNLIMRLLENLSSPSEG